MSFTNTWDADNPSDSTVANEIDDYMNALRTDVEERLSDLVYGFSGSEDDGNQGLKAAIFRQQGSAPTVSTDEIGLYAYEDNSQCCLYAKEEGTDTRKILTSDGTDITINLLAEDITADLIDETKIQLNNNSYLEAANNAGDGTINLVMAGTSDKPVLGSKARLRSDSATQSSDGDRTIADKGFVDAAPAAQTTPTSYAGGKEVTLPNGIQMKWGTFTFPDNSDTQTIDFTDEGYTDFDNACEVVTAVSGESSGQRGSNPNTHTFTTTSFKMYRYDANSGDIYHWFAIGY